MARNRHLRDGDNALHVPDGVSLKLGKYGTLPTCNAKRENHIAIQGGVIYLCDGSTWQAVGTSATGVLAVKEGGSAIDSNVNTLDFDASDFNLTESPEDEINISLNYGTSAGQPAEGNHTHTSSAITDFATAVDERARDAVGTALTAGTGITVTPDDGANTITVATTITQYTDEMAQDAVGAMLADSSEIDFTYTDATPALTATLKAGSIDET